MSSPRMPLRSSPPPPAIPRLFLYGEPATDVEADFLHVEAIPVRSGLNDWTIRPHAHPKHGQFLLVTRGGGSIRIEDRLWRLTPPAVLAVPAGAVHSIDFAPGTDGVVITVASAYLDPLVRLDPALSRAIKTVAAYDLAPDWEETEEIQTAAASLAREFAWQAAARRAAVQAHFLRFLVGLSRVEVRIGTGETLALASRSLDIVHRFRELVEQNFRTGHPIGFYADRLHVTHARLNVACRAVTGASASHLLFDRIIVEAKRDLLYTAQTVAEVAYAVGFSDPAYFCRFFSKRTGVAPSQFRTSALRSDAAFLPG